MKRIIFYFATITILFSSCSESILSDVDIVDPRVLKVKVKIEQDADNDKEVQIFVRDKNNHPVDLLYGKVIVNGERVPYTRASVNELDQRGYIYEPYNNEHQFQITIFWNEHDHHSFILNR